MAHRCNLSGTFANNTHFVKAKHFTVYDNRLSGALPQTLLNTSIINTSIVLPSNLFRIEGEPPDWLAKSSHFLSVTSMYITSSDVIWSFVLLCLSGVISIIHVILALKEHSVFKATTSGTALDAFFQIISSLLKLFDNTIMWLIAISCGLSYYFNSNYFAFCTITQQISISFYHSEHITWDWIVVILWVGYFSFLGYRILKLQNTMTKQNIFVKPAQDRTLSAISGSTITHRLLKVAMWTSLFFMSNGFVVLSVICDNLPDHNIFNMQQYVIGWIKKSVGIVLAINTAFIIPHFVDSSVYLFLPRISPSVYICKYRPLIILIIRTWCIVIVPLVSSVVLSSHCGNHWTSYWNECIKSDLRNQFDVKYPLKIPDPYYSSTTFTSNITLLSSKSVCEAQTIDDIDWDKCIRFFTADWSLVIIQKLCFMMLLPYLMIIIKTI
eukprot:183217_1